MPPTQHTNAISRSEVRKDIKTRIYRKKLSTCTRTVVKLLKRNNRFESHICICRRMIS